MKYHFFCGEEYYALGGGRDFKQSSNNLQELIDLGDKMIYTPKYQKLPYCDWYHITDEEMNIVYKSVLQAHG